MRLEEIRPLNEANIVNPQDIDLWVEQVCYMQDIGPPWDKWLAKRLRQFLTGLPDDTAGSYLVTALDGTHRGVMTDPPGEDPTLTRLAARYGGWVRDAASRGETLYRFNPSGAGRAEIRRNTVELFRHVTDYLTSLIKVSGSPDEHEAPLQSEAARRLSKLARQPLEVAHDQADDWFARVQAAGREHAERLEAAATKPVMEFHDGFRWVQLTDRAALDREGDLMGHCVGGGSYDERMRKDLCRIYSLRDPQNQPHITVEVIHDQEWDEDGEFYHDTGNYGLEQAKGKRNEPPVAKYRPYLKAFLNQTKLPPTPNGADDLAGSGLFKHPEEDRYGTMKEMGHPVMMVGDLEIMADPNHTALHVMRGDVSLGWFGFMGMGTGDRDLPEHKLLDRVGGWTEQNFPRDVVKTVCNALTEAGYRFFSGVKDWLMSRLLVQKDGHLVDATEMPPERRLGPYRLVYLEEGPLGNAHIWVFDDRQPDGLAAALVYYRWGSQQGGIGQDCLTPLPEDCTAELAEIIVSFLNDKNIRDVRTRRNIYDMLNNLTTVNPGGPFIARTDLPSLSEIRSPEEPS